MPALVVEEEEPTAVSTPSEPIIWMCPSLLASDKTASEPVPLSKVETLLKTSKTKTKFYYESTNHDRADDVLNRVYVDIDGGATAMAPEEFASTHAAIIARLIAMGTDEEPVNVMTSSRRYETGAVKFS
jgi:hypothetical protein